MRPARALSRATRRRGERGVETDVSHPVAIVCGRNITAELLAEVLAG